jgi:ABC-type branched-subunit amino acid transport system substrate-binding protein
MEEQTKTHDQIEKAFKNNAKDYIERHINNIDWDNVGDHSPYTLINQIVEDIHEENPDIVISDSEKDQMALMFTMVLLNLRLGK